MWPTSSRVRTWTTAGQVHDPACAEVLDCWFLMASPILRGGDLTVTEVGIRDAVREALLPLWNTYYFLALYANAENMEGRTRTNSAHVTSW